MPNALRMEVSRCCDGALRPVSPQAQTSPDEMFFFPQFRYKSDLMGMKGTGWLALSSPQIESAKKAGELISEVPPTCLCCNYSLALISFCRGNLFGPGGLGRGVEWG